MNDIENSQAETVNNTPPANNSNSNNRNPYTIWFVVLSFVAPALLAYGLYFFGDIKSFSNHGEILNPIAHIRNFQLRDDKGQLITEDKLTYKWRMISFLGKSCDQSCAKRLYDSRQVYTSLGKDRHRVLRMFVHLEPADNTLKQLIKTEHPNAIQVNGDEPSIIKALPEKSSITNNEIYIMDPMGNVMMRFTQDQPDRDLLTDLKRLLKVSQIG
jgi:cytochrome oxidase Cu insertion factor (SCO1/SenC/PrrC family)